MGISEDDLDMLSDEMSSIFGQSEENEDGENDAQTATFPLLNQLFRHRQQSAPPRKGRKSSRKRPQGGEEKVKHKFLDAYCMDLTGRARGGKLDKVIGRDVETERVIQIPEPPSEEQSLPHRRAGRWQDRHCRSRGPAHCRRGRALQTPG